MTMIRDGAACDWNDLTPMMDLTEQQIPWNAPHPVLGCTCGEGRVLTEYTKGSHKIVRYWLPGVHDCQYIKDLNKRLGIDG